jgi:outer membrane protein
VKQRMFFAAAAVMGFLVLMPGKGLAQMTMTLEKCLEQGIENNTTLKAAWYDIQGAAHDIKSVRADFLPSLSTGYSSRLISSESVKGPSDPDYLDQTAHQFNIRLSQILYNGHRLVNNYNKARVRKKVMEADTRMDLLQQVFQIETTFYRLLKAKQDVIARTESVENLNESVRSAQAFFEKQLVPYVNVLQAQVDLADAKENLAKARNNVNRERVALFSLMNRPADPGIEFSGELAPLVLEVPGFESALAKALEDRPDIESLTLQLDLSRKDAAIAMGRYLPTVRLEAGYNDDTRDFDALGTSGFQQFDRDQRNRYWSAGIHVTWELFDGGRAWYEKERHKTHEQKIHALINEAENTISAGIRQSLLSMAEARQRIQGSIQALDAAEEYSALEEQRLNAGISTIPDFLDAQDRLVRAQGNYAQAILDFRLAESELKLMTGKIPPIAVSFLN